MAGEDDSGVRLSGSDDGVAPAAGEVAWSRGQVGRCGGGWILGREASGSGFKSDFIFLYTFLI